MNRQKFLAKIGRRNRPNKYRAIKVEDYVDGKLVKFASKAEYHRYRELCMQRDAGLIANLQLQVEFPCVVNGRHVCSYFADFTYLRNGVGVVEDVKGWTPPLYRLKKKLVEAIWDVKIQEIRK